MANKEYCIPFNELQQAIGASPNIPHTRRQEQHWHKKFPFTVRGVALDVERGDFGLCDNSMCTEILSDTAMELLAQLVKAELEKYANIDQLAKQHSDCDPSDDETLADFLFKEEENLLVSKFGVEYDKDLDKQEIERGKRCYNRDTGEYVVFISDAEKDTATDGYNCIVAPDGKLPIPARVPLRFARKCDLVQEY